MAKINTLNYQTIASWNGSEDLLVVEQPDGTKVATPAMMKQFIEAGDFEATGEIIDGHGNTLNDMAKSADVATEIANKIKFTARSKVQYQCTSTSYEYTGANITCPAGHTYIVRAQAKYNTAQIMGILASTSNTTYAKYQTINRNDEASFITFMLTEGETAYIWAKWATANTLNDVVVSYVDITN